MSHTDIEIPSYQRLLRYAKYILWGILALGALLESIVHAKALITFRVAVWGTGLVVGAWIITELVIRWFSIWWVWRDGQRSRVTKLGISERLAMVGVVLLLWVPRVLDGSRQSLETSRPLVSTRLDGKQKPAEPVESVLLTREEVREIVRQSVDEVMKKYLKPGAQLPKAIMNLQNFGDQVLRLSMAHSRRAPLPSAEADRLLHVASVFLSPCNVRLERLGQVATSPISVLGSVNDFARASSGANIQVLDSIEWCGGRGQPGNAFSGCSDHSRHVFLAAGYERFGGLSLAHEIGHLAGLDDNNDEHSLMKGMIDPLVADLAIFPQLSVEECKAISQLPARFHE